jgi:PPOX class probable F420-dependent enzyme
MPKPPLPSALDAFLAEPNPSVIASLRTDGSPHTAATWYLWEDGRVLVNMDEGRTRLEYLRHDPRVSITVLGASDWYHHVTLRGRVVELLEDPDCAAIDRISRHYTGQPYAQRDRGRWSAWIEVEAWHAWAIGEPWTGQEAA